MLLLDPHTEAPAIGCLLLLFGDEDVDLAKLKSFDICINFPLQCTNWSSFIHLFVSYISRLLRPRDVRESKSAPTYRLNFDEYKWIVQHIRVVWCRLRYNILHTYAWRAWFGCSDARTPCEANVWFMSPLCLQHFQPPPVWASCLHRAYVLHNYVVFRVPRFNTCNVCRTRIHVIDICRHTFWVEQTKDYYLWIYRVPYAWNYLNHPRRDLIYSINSATK